MTVYDGFEKIFNNAFAVIDMDFKNCTSFTELEAYDKTVDHNFVHELINWFAVNYNTNILGLYKDYLKKCKNSYLDKINNLINEDC